MGFSGSTGSRKLEALLWVRRSKLEPVKVPRFGVFAAAAIGLWACVYDKPSLVGSQTAGDSAPLNVLTVAAADRARAESAVGVPRALGSFYRRVWAQEFERLLTPLRASPLASSVPEELNGITAAAWQSSLDEGWKTEDPDTALASARGVTAALAASRAALEQLVTDPNLATGDPGAYAAALSVRAILSEFVLEAEVLSLRDSGATAAFEEFVARRPDGPYTASVLFALGTLHETRREFADAKGAFTRLLERFPTHPLAEQARRRLEAL